MVLIKKYIEFKFVKFEFYKITVDMIEYKSLISYPSINLLLQYVLHGIIKIYESYVHSHLDVHRIMFFHNFSQSTLCPLSVWNSKRLKPSQKITYMLSTNFNGAEFWEKTIILIICILCSIVYFSIITLKTKHSGVISLINDVLGIITIKSIRNIRALFPDKVFMNTRTRRREVCPSLSGDVSVKTDKLQIPVCTMNRCPSWGHNVALQVPPQRVRYGIMCRP